ncbi:MAG: hypothetical protein JNK27_16845 [Chitinophagaceae bacterium]|nr:hypothetical protein [Chitinophagaceae bacterium]
MKKVIIVLISGLLFTTVTAQSYRGSNYQPSLEQKLNDMYCSGLFKSTDGSIFEIASVPGINAYTNILDWLQGRVAGLRVFTNRTGVSVPYIRGGVPGIFVDEMQVSAGYLESLNINDIAIVKIIKTPFFGGFNGGNGAIAIYTLGGEEEEEEETISR